VPAPVPESIIAKFGRRFSSDALAPLSRSFSLSLSLSLSLVALADGTRYGATAGASFDAPPSRFDVSCRVSFSGKIDESEIPANSPRTYRWRNVDSPIRAIQLRIRASLTADLNALPFGFLILARASIKLERPRRMSPGRSELPWLDLHGNPTFITSPLDSDTRRGARCVMPQESGVIFA